jgi:hypothetical protein
MSERFTLRRVKGGWQIFDTERKEHVGRVFVRHHYAKQYLATLDGKRPDIVRFILTGSSK